MAKRKKNGKKRNFRKPKPMKIAALIMSAIQNLRETKGSTPKKIIDYISYASNVGQDRVKRQVLVDYLSHLMYSWVNTALKRGVEYGILRRFRGYYFLPSGDDLNRANRIAVRFARLPTPAPAAFSSKIATKKAGKLKGYSSVNSRKLPLPIIDRKKRRARSLPLSITSNFLGSHYCEAE